MEHLDKLYAPPIEIVAVPVNSEGTLARIVITTKDGRIFDLGSRDSIFFRIRLAWYKWLRRKEL